MPEHHRTPANGFEGGVHRTGTLERGARARRGAKGPKDTYREHPRESLAAVNL